MWACTFTYGSIGIDVGRMWPDPTCCCYYSHKSGGDRGTSYGCAPLLHSCVAMLVLQAVFLLLHVILLAMGGNEWVISLFGLVIDTAGLATIIAAVALLRKGYSLHGGPSPPGSTQRTANQIVQMVPMQATAVHMAPPAVTTTIAYGTPAYPPPPVTTATVTSYQCS